MPVRKSVHFVSSVHLFVVESRRLVIPVRVGCVQIIVVKTYTTDSFLLIHSRDFRFAYRAVDLRQIANRIARDSCAILG